MSGLFKGSSNTVTQEALLTPEQKQAMQQLLQLGTTGSAGNLTLGKAYEGSLGDFNQTGTQQVAGNRLLDLLQSANPSGYDTARNSLTGLANNRFNPDDPSSGYAAYANQANRAFQTSNDVLNRQAAITGDRFSTAIGKDRNNLALQNNDLLATKLADLYNTAQDRSLSASQALGNLETQQGANSRANIAAGFDPLQGGLQNTLNNAQAQASYNEFQRQRNEQLKQIDALNTVYNKNVPFGVMSTTATTPSPFSGLLNSALGAAGTAIGGPIGGMIGNSISGLFNSASSSAGTRSALDPTALLGGYGLIGR